MITLRQHLVSLIAVFLALGLGVLAGTTFITPGTVNALRKSLDALSARDNAVESQNSQLKSELAGLESDGSAARDQLVSGALAGRATMLVSFDSTTANETSDMAATLAEAGARLTGSYVLSSNLGLPNEASRQQVAGALGLPVNSSAGTIETAEVQRITDWLDGKSPGLIGKLTGAGLATANSVPSPLAGGTPAGSGTDIVVLTPAQSPAAPAANTANLASQLILPLARALSSTAVLLAVGEDGTNPLPVLQLLRGDSTVKAVTVDGVDQPIGQAAVALGLRDAAAGVWGDYGNGQGASTPLPSPLPSPPPASPPSTPASTAPSTPPPVTPGVTARPS
ncbi:MAG TPA: copper transporter [Actinomycetota bacterium]|nr:copper transporter [Actinomycetota bacterium]